MRLIITRASSRMMGAFELGTVSVPSGVLVLGMAGWIDYWPQTGESLSQRAAVAARQRGDHLRDGLCEAIAARSSAGPQLARAVMATAVPAASAAARTLGDRRRRGLRSSSPIVMRGSLPVLDGPSPPDSSHPLTRRRASLPPSAGGPPIPAIDAPRVPPDATPGIVPPDRPALGASSRNAAVLAPAPNGGYRTLVLSRPSQCVTVIVVTGQPVTPRPRRSR
jgi:hypothetical protein